MCQFINLGEEVRIINGNPEFRIQNGRWHSESENQGIRITGLPVNDENDGEIM
jgi:hypothetical protein